MPQPESLPEKDCETEIDSDASAAEYQQALEDVNIVKLGFIVEGALAALALGIGYLGFYDLPQPLNSITTETWRQALLWGVVGMGPMLVYLIVFHFWPVGILRDMRTFVDENLTQIFRGLGLHHLLIISLLAGFCEEILFRWCLQGGIAAMIGGQSGMIVGLLVASLFFGICHWVNFSYAFCTTVVGIYFGAMMIWTGTWLAPAVTHTLFDFVALIYICRSAPK